VHTTHRRGDHTLGLAFWVGLLALLGGAVLLLIVLGTQGVDRAATWASVLGTGLAITGALVTLVTWRLRQRAAAGRPALVAQVTRAAQELQAVVREQWRQEAEARSLGDPDPMPVRWRLSDPAVMDHDEHIAPVPLRFAGRSDRIPELTDQFRKLRRRRLVIVGGPGSGKTTLAVQLLLQLLEGWHAGEPVPVLFSLSSWYPHTQSRVQDWLADQLVQTYPNLLTFGADAAQKLADQGWLLPVLDGLDEIPSERRGEVIDRLNASLHPDTGLILTSRTTEYTKTVRTCDVLTAAAVIEPEPLTSSEAAAYLKDLLPRRPGESWQAVLTALRCGTAGTLAEVVASPLGLWLLRIVHIEGRRDPQPLIDRGHYPNAVSIQQHLFEELISAAVRSRPPLSSGQAPLRPQRHQDPVQVRRWLTTLAIQLRGAKTRDWRWWHLARHTFTRRQFALVFTLVGGLLFGLVGALMGSLGDGLGNGLVGGLVGALMGVLMGGLRGGLAVGLVGALMGGLVFGMVFGLVGALLGALVLGQVLGLVGEWLGRGMGGGLARDPDAPLHADLPIRGRAREFGSELGLGLGSGLGYGLMYGLAGGVAGGFVYRLARWLAGGPDRRLGGWGAGGLAVELTTGLFQGLAGGLAGGLVLGLVAGLMSGLFSFAAGLSIAPRASSPAASQRGDRRLTVLATSMLGLVGILVGLVGLGGTFVGGLVVGLMGGLVFGLATSSTYWPTFVLASLWLAARRRLPFALMDFLDDAYRLGLLRIVGPVYQFRHAALQDHLAPPTEAPAAAAADPPTPLRT
jgi:hypothetical protein